MVGLDRLELSTSPLSGVRSNHLSYRPKQFLPKAKMRCAGRQLPEANAGRRGPLATRGARRTNPHPRSRGT